MSDSSICQPAYNLGLVENIPAGEGRAFALDCATVAVFRSKDGRVFATQAWCPHRQGPLADGIVGGGQIICPLHGYKFDLETGNPLESDCEAIRTYTVSVSDSGDILLHMKDNGFD
ncbi:MAG: Rieske (2Fe-2S) protein [Blastocatellia bacterium]